MKKIFALLAFCSSLGGLQAMEPPKPEMAENFTFTVNNNTDKTLYVKLFNTYEPPKSKTGRDTAEFIAKQVEEKAAERAKMGHPMTEQEKRQMTRTMSLAGFAAHAVGWLVGPSLSALTDTTLEVPPITPFAPGRASLVVDNKKRKSADLLVYVTPDKPASGDIPYVKPDDRAAHKVSMSKEAPLLEITIEKEAGSYKIKKEHSQQFSISNSPGEA